MTKEQMNVHKALIELNLLGDRISSRINNAKFCVCNRANNTKIGGVDIADFESQAKEDLQSIDDMIRRYNAIKRAVVLSNATTEVEVAGSKYTVAEAIYMKNHGFDYEVALFSAINRQFNSAVRDCDIKNSNLEERAYDYVLGLYGGSDKVVKDHQKDVDDYIENNSYGLVDPINVVGEYNERSLKYDQFMAEVDSALSTSNALTVLEIEY